MVETFDGIVVLIIDDDQPLRQTVEMTFSLYGAKVITAGDGRSGLHAFFANKPDLVVLDINMPDIMGWEVLEKIREASSTPVVMLTTLDADAQVVKGLDLGADDFISKPFSVSVLVARVQAVLRRAARAVVETGIGYHDGYLIVDLETRRVIVKGEEVKLTATEFQLLTYLLENAGRVLTYNQILESVWGWEYKDSTDYVHVYLSHLRRKIEQDPRQPNYLLTEHGVGYRFQKATN